MFDVVGVVIVVVAFFVFFVVFAATTYFVVVSCVSSVISNLFGCRCCSNTTVKNLCTFINVNIVSYIYVTGFNVTAYVIISICVLVGVGGGAGAGAGLYTRFSKQ